MAIQSELTFIAQTVKLFNAAVVVPAIGCQTWSLLESKINVIHQNSFEPAIILTISGLRKQYSSSDMAQWQQEMILVRCIAAAR